MLWPSTPPNCAYPGNAGWQHDLSVSYTNVGDVQVEQGDLAGALKSYRDSLAIRERLASDPGNAGWQHDLSASYTNVGNVQVAQGDLAGALTSYRDDLAIAERLAKSDPSNAGWQRDLSVSYTNVGDVQVEQGDLAGALTSYRDSLAIRERLAKSDPPATPAGSVICPFRMEGSRAHSRGRVRTQRRSTRYGRAGPSWCA